MQKKIGVFKNLKICVGNERREGVIFVYFDCKI